MKKVVLLIRIISNEDLSLVLTNYNKTKENTFIIHYILLRILQYNPYLLLRSKNKPKSDSFNWNQL